MSDDEYGHPINPMSSVSRDLKNTRANSGAVAGEVREFLAQMQGKSPQEMLGLIAQSSLLKCTIQAIIVMIVIVLVFTIIPFGMAKLKSGDATKAQAVVEAPTAPDVNSAATPEPSETATTAAEPEVPQEKDDLLDKLGVGETKVAPAKENPLDGGADDLFKDLE